MQNTHREGERYVGGTPITAMARFGERLLVAGGGGNPLFGKPNVAMLLDSDNRILHKISVSGVASGISSHGNLAIIHYTEGGNEICTVEETISTPAKLPEEMVSPVVCKNRIYYTNSEREVRTEPADKYVEGAGKGNGAAEIVYPEGVFSKILVIGDTINCVTEKGGHRILTYNGRSYVLDGEVVSYAYESGLLVYLCQIEGGKSVVRMSGGMNCLALESKATCVSTDGRNVVCGTGDGYVLVYRDQKRIMRKRVFDFPITNIAIIRGRAVFSTLDGKLLNARIPMDFKRIKRGSVLLIFLVLLAVALTPAARIAVGEMVGELLFWTAVKVFLFVKNNSTVNTLVSKGVSYCPFPH
jgi:hypothetical protein